MVEKPQLQVVFNKEVQILRNIPNDTLLWIRTKHFSSVIKDISSTFE